MCVFAVGRDPLFVPFAMTPCPGCLDAHSTFEFWFLKSGSRGTGES